MRMLMWTVNYVHFILTRHFFCRYSSKTDKNETRYNLRRCRSSFLRRADQGPDYGSCWTSWRSKRYRCQMFHAIWQGNRELRELLGHCSRVPREWPRLRPNQVQQELRRLFPPCLCCRSTMPCWWPRVKNLSNKFTWKSETLFFKYTWHRSK